MTGNRTIWSVPNVISLPARLFNRKITAFTQKVLKIFAREFGMSLVEETKTAALGGVAVIIAEFALQLSGYQNPRPSDGFLAILAVFLPLLIEGQKFAWTTSKRVWGTVWCKPGARLDR